MVDTIGSVIIVILMYLVFWFGNMREISVWDNKLVGKRLRLSAVVERILFIFPKVLKKDNGKIMAYTVVSQTLLQINLLVTIVFFVRTNIDQWWELLAPYVLRTAFCIMPAAVGEQIARIRYAYKYRRKSKEPARESDRFMSLLIDGEKEPYEVKPGAVYLIIGIVGTVCILGMTWYAWNEQIPQLTFMTKYLYTPLFTIICFPAFLYYFRKRMIVESGKVNIRPVFGDKKEISFSEITEIAIHGNRGIAEPVAVYVQNKRVYIVRTSDVGYARFRMHMEEIMPEKVKQYG